MSRPRHHRRAALAAVATTALALALSTAGVAGHDHLVNKDTGRRETTLAHSQNHPVPFIEDDGLWLSCTLEGWTLPGDFGPAWYGLETAHHGADSGDPGKADSCYAADANPAPFVDGDDQNPAID